MKEEFLTFIDQLIQHDENYANTILTENAKLYLDILRNVEIKEKPVITDNGKVVLKFLQDNIETSAWRSKDIADQLTISSRSVSGTLRKLVTDGFCEKIGKDPIFYSLTEKGKNFIIE